MTASHGVAARLLVPFEGDGAGTDVLSWGQQAIWLRILAGGGRSVMVSGVVPLPAGRTLDDAVATVRFVMSRHQSLRTRLRFGPDGQVRQVLAPAGEVPLEVVDADDADPAEVATAILDRYQRTDFDYAHEWPIRIAMIRRHGELTHAVAGYLHLAIDGHGVDILVADLANMRHDGLPVALPAGMPPLEQARSQRTPAVRRQHDASLRHIARVLRTLSPHRFGPGNGAPEPDYRTVRYRSPATLLASRLIAARDGVTGSPILMAAMAVTLARLTGINPVMASLQVSNRFRPGFATSVSCVAQVSPCLVDVGGTTVGDAVKRAAAAMFSAYKYAYYEPVERQKLIAAIDAERGVEIDRSCVFNDRRAQDGAGTAALPDPAQLRQARDQGRLHWLAKPVQARQKLYLHVDDAPDAVEFTLTCDTRYLSPADMETIVRGLEAVTVEAALDPAASTGIEVRPPRR